MYAEAILKKGEGRTLKSGGAWVYDNEIDRVEGDYEMRYSCGKGF